MIIVDVYVPALDKEYNFSFDQNAEVGIIIEEVSEMIARKEQTKLSGNIEELILCDKSSQTILTRKQTLGENGIQTGSRLILI